MKETSKHIEAYGVKGLKSTPWRGTFKSPEALTKWAEQHDAEVHAVSEVEPPVPRRTKARFKAALRVFNDPALNDLLKHL
jgi:hypothetical protein